MLVYPSSIDLSTSTLRFLARELRARRRNIGTRWRRLPVARQALLALAHLRCGDTYAQLAAGFGIGIATVYRYVCEPSRFWPPSPQAMKTIRTKAFVVLSTAPCCPSTASPPTPRTTPGNPNATA